jgi:hypothetical protein
MLTPYQEIKEFIAREIDTDDYGTNAADDRIRELADSEVPIYYSEIIDEWREMPMAYTDKWRELGTGDYDSMTITSLMQIDLSIYYLDQFEMAYSELQDELAESEDN